MNKKVYFILALILIIALLAVPVSAGKPVNDAAPRIEDAVEASAKPADAWVADLIAGQTEDVGDIYINKTAVENVYEVGYVTVGGWVLTEVHFEALYEGEREFVSNKGGLVPGQFTVNESYDKEAGITEVAFRYVAGEETVEFAAHAVVEKTVCVTNAEAPYGAGSVVDYAQGKTLAGNDITINRSNPQTVLTFEDNKDERNFFSLGFETELVSGGYITVQFDYPVTNGPGNDIIIIEDTWGLPYPNEQVEVFVSNDGATWYTLGYANNQSPYDSIHTAFEFNLDAVGMDSAMYVRVEDRTEKLAFTEPRYYPTADGYDVNVIYAVHDNVICTEYKESAWGAGVDAGTSNWSMVILEGCVADYYQWELEQELRVEFFNAPATPAVSNPLASGGEYKIEAIGTYRFANWGEAGIADARYSYRTVSTLPASYLPATEPQWVDGADLGEKYPGYDYYLQVWMDGMFIEWEEEFNTDHIYTAEIMGAGLPVSFNIFDTSYGDNTGGIDVNIYQWVLVW